MEWIDSLSFKRKLQAGCFFIITLFSLVMLIMMFSSSFPTPLGIIILIVLIIGSYFLINLIEKALTTPITNISRIALNISKGDFSQKVVITSDDALGELGVSF